MKLQEQTYKDAYLPVDPDFLELLTQLTHENRSGKVHFFNTRNDVDDVQGVLKALVKTRSGEFLQLIGGSAVRVDKIITVLGKPGPAFDEYDSYGSVCFNCFDHGQF
ncbi:MAG: hypothetical protein KI790_13740 [Cyclobacteriaceae bacterium]|nr:hypothetical protein [Cyclobacteriaceae bacterium HetDA_MAG_MS6]